MRLQKKSPPPGVVPDLDSVSGCVKFFWDAQTGDFNVILNVEDPTEMSSEILGMLMCYISQGHMTPFLAESLELWCDSPDKMEFYTNTLKTWNIMKGLQEEQRAVSEEQPLIHPADVFRFKGNPDDN